LTNALAYYKIRLKLRRNNFFVYIPRFQISDPKASTANGDALSNTEPKMLEGSDAEPQLLTPSTTDRDLNRFPSEKKKRLNEEENRSAKKKKKRRKLSHDLNHSFGLKSEAEARLAEPEHYELENRPGVKCYKSFSFVTDVRAK
jgi:hypothetical protein